MKRGTELDPERTETLGVVRQNTNDELRTRVSALDLVQFVGVVEGHHLDALVGGVSNERNGFARVGKYDAGGVNPSNLEDVGNFVDRRAVETGTHSSKEANDVGVRVAFDG